MELKTVHINPFPEGLCPSVLVVYTGGTFGMVYETKGSQLVPFNFDQITEKVPEIQRLNISISVLSLSEPIDSSNITPAIWVQLASTIEDHYERYDGFVILHGTDTMAYSASALSYLLDGLNKPVILTGAQLPIGVARSDARENFITALELAAAVKQNGTPILSEVCIYFNSLLLRGNRCKKQESSDFNAFHSENYPHLANAGVLIEYNLPFIKPYEPNAKLKVHKSFDSNVAILKLFPGISESVVNSLLGISGLKGVVLETYGAGNATTAAWFLSAMETAIAKGIIIFNVSQCDGGRVAQGHYQTSKFLDEVGVISGLDITVEAAITKMMYIFGNFTNHADQRKLLATPLRGEMSA